jgi:hypothetical protein
MHTHRDAVPVLQHLCDVLGQHYVTSTRPLCKIDTESGLGVHEKHSQDWLDVTGQNGGLCLAAKASVEELDGVCAACQSW